MAKKTNKILDLLERKGGQLFQLLYHLVLDEKAAEELMQELFIKLNEFEHFEKIRNIDAYARKVAIRLAFDWWKKKPHEGNLNQLGEHESNDPSPISKAITQEELGKVIAAIGKLKGESREAFILYYLESKSYEQIAKAMDKNAHQVRGLCNKALKKMRRILGFEDIYNSAREGRT